MEYAQEHKLQATVKEEQREKVNYNAVSSEFSADWTYEEFWSYILVLKGQGNSVYAQD